MTFFRGEEGFWAAASSQRTLYLVRDKIPSWMAFFKADGKGRSSFLTTKALVVFFSTFQVIRFAKDYSLSFESGRKGSQSISSTKRWGNILSIASPTGCQKTEKPSVESGRKDSGSFSPAKRIVSFFRPIFRSKNSSH